MAENIAYTLTRNDSGINANMVEGVIVFPATAIVATDYVEIDVGFQPRYVNFLNITDRVGGEYWKGMADNSCLKTIADGTRTLEVTGGNGGITLTTRGFRVLQNATLALVLASKTINFHCIA
jgi:hypothetical protein